MTIRIYVQSDGDIQNPADFDGAWTPHSFGRRHRSYKDPEELGLSLERGEDGTPKVTNPGLRRKLEVGLAFFLSYFEHGSSKWSLLDEGPRCRFDSVRIAGLLIWNHKPGDMGAKTREERAEDARTFLETYNHWCNGEGLGYRLESLEKCDRGETHEEHIDSCWGYFANDVEYVFDCIYQAIPDDRRNELIEWAGDLKYLADTHWPKAVERATRLATTEKK